MPLTTNNLRMQSISKLLLPKALSDSIKVSEKAAELITKTRSSAAHIMKGKEDRLLVVVGPCSIHDTQAALEYARKLKTCADRFEHELLIIMRVYFEKPRTTIGWKGLINDPKLDNSFDINHGLTLARQLMADISAIGLPIATEFLDTITPQFISDFVSWAAIGARTAESPIHRQLASGLSMPVGFKNGTGGNVKIAVDAVLAAMSPHHFLGIAEDASAAIIKTAGNQDCHVILRGSYIGTNYDKDSIFTISKSLESAGLAPCLMVDCSHGNSGKDHRRQSEVAKNVARQIAEGSKAICAVMIESHLFEGKQELSKDQALAYGQSITDACIGFDETVQLLDVLAQAVRASRLLKSGPRSIIN